MRRSSLGALALAATLTVGTNVAFAQAPAASATAEALFAEGRRLVADGKFAEACPKFEGAQRVAPTPGTLLNLANCYEKAGRTASAWASFRDAISMAKGAGRADLAEQAQKRAAALEPKLARLSVTVTATAANLEILRDGTPIPREAWSTPVPVDPGEHVIEAKAPGRKSLRLTAQSPIEGQTATLNVPELEVDPAAASTAPAGSSASASGDGTPGAQPTATNGGAGTDRNSADPGATQRLLGIGVAGLGVAGLIVGGVFAASASSKNDDSKAECRSEAPNLCSQAGKDLRDDAQSAGTVATVGFVAGALLIGGGAALFFTAPKASSSTPNMALAPTPGGLLLRGSFQ